MRYYTTVIMYSARQDVALQDELRRGYIHDNTELRNM